MPSEIDANAQDARAAITRLEAQLYSTRKELAVAKSRIEAWEAAPVEVVDATTPSRLVQQIRKYDPSFVVPAEVAYKWETSYKTARTSGRRYPARPWSQIKIDNSGKVWGPDWADHLEIGPGVFDRQHGGDQIKVDGDANVTARNVVTNGFVNGGAHIDSLQQNLGAPTIRVVGSVVDNMGADGWHGNGTQVLAGTCYWDNVAIIGGNHPITMRSHEGMLHVKDVWVFMLTAVNYKKRDGALRYGPPLVHNYDSIHPDAIKTWENVNLVWPDGSAEPWVRP